MADEQRSLTANFTANASGFAQGSNEVIQHLRELNTEMANVRNQIKETNQQVRQYEQRLEELRRATGNGENATEEQRREMQQLEDAIAQCNVDLGAHRTAQQRLQSEIRSTNRQLDDMRSGTMTVSQAFTNMGTVLRANLLSGAIQTALSEIVQLLCTTVTYCYDVGSQFEAGMSQVGAISGATGAELDALTAKAKEMGASTKFTATQAAEALNYMAMAGWKTEDMLSGIDGVINLAAASGEDLGAVSDIVTDALTAFGLSAKDSAHFADVLAAASANSNTNVAMMGETFTYCAPIAGALGYSIEDTATAIGIMANSGIKASQAGTALRTIMTNLSSDVTIAGEKIGEVTVKTTNADGSMREFADIIADLRVAFSGLSESEKTATAENIAGKYAMSGFLALVNAAESDVAALTEVINNCEGATADMAETMQNNLAGKVTIMQSALEGLGISIYEKFGEGVSESVDMLTESLGALDEKVKGGALDSSIDNLNDSLVELVDELTDAGEEAIPDFINGVADVISFVIELREVIGAGINAFVAYKGAMTIGSIIQTAVQAYSELKVALGTTTVAQTALNAAAAVNPYTLVAIAISAVVGAATLLTPVLSELYRQTGLTNDEFEELVAKSEELAQTAEDYKEKSDNIGDIASEYARIKNEVTDVNEQTAELRDLQQDLIDQYGVQAAGIDLVNGSYEKQLTLLQDLRSENSALYTATNESRLDAEREAEKQTYYVDAEIENEDLARHIDKWIYENLETTDTGLTGDYETLNTHIWDGTIGFTGSYIDRASEMEALYDYLGTLSAEHPEVQQLRNNLSAAWGTMYAGQKRIGELETLLDPSSQYQNSYGPGVIYHSTAEEMAERGKAELEAWKALQGEKAAKAAADAEELAELYKTEKQLADDQYSVQEISAEEYYNKLQTLRDEYLTEGAHEWYAATAELMKLMEQTGKSLADPIKEGLEEIKTEFQKTLDAIDAEIERRNRAKQDSELKEKIDAVTARLTYEQLDEYSRRSLEKELKELNEERADIAFERQTTDSKVALRNAYDATQSLANAVPEGYNARSWVDTLDRAFAEMSQGYMPNSTVKDQAEAAAVYNIVINAENKTPQQIYNEIKGYFGGVI